jgi:hypothetical protein
MVGILVHGDLTGLVIERIRKIDTIDSVKAPSGPRHGQ